ncbi:hypothetical protein ABBQ38_002654 [Trebouxia sp. C0009 RCD-2024]
MGILTLMLVSGFRLLPAGVVLVAWAAVPMAGSSRKAGSSVGMRPLRAVDGTAIPASTLGFLAEGSRPSMHSNIISTHSNANVDDCYPKQPNCVADQITI